MLPTKRTGFVIVIIRMFVCPSRGLQKPDDLPEHATLKRPVVRSHSGNAGTSAHTAIAASEPGRQGRQCQPRLRALYVWDRPAADQEDQTGG